MRHLVGFVIAGAVVAATVWLSLSFAFMSGPSGSEAKPDLSVQSIVVFALCVAVLFLIVLAVVAELRHVIEHRRHRHDPHAPSTS